MSQSLHLVLTLRTKIGSKMAKLRTMSCAQKSIRKSLKTFLKKSFRFVISIKHFDIKDILTIDI